MTVFVCVSEGGGMTFAERRVSRDAAVVADIINLASGKKLLISEYSAKLFQENATEIKVVPKPLEYAESTDFAFVENPPLSPHKRKISRLIIYHWNRRYPFDTRLDISPSELGMNLLESLDFQGKSHGKITREIWAK